MGLVPVPLRRIARANCPLEPNPLSCVLPHMASWPWVRRSKTMWMMIGVILLVLWLLGAFAFHIAGGLIHILLVIALIAVVVHFVTGRKVV